MELKVKFQKPTNKKQEKRRKLNRKMEGSSPRISFTPSPSTKLGIGRWYLGNLMCIWCCYEANSSFCMAPYFLFCTHIHKRIILMASEFKSLTFFFTKYIYVLNNLFTCKRQILINKLLYSPLKTDIGKVGRLTSIWIR